MQTRGIRSEEGISNLWGTELDTRFLSPDSNFCCDPGAICLIQEIACPRCHVLPISHSTEDTQEISYLENLDSLGGELSSTQKETLLKEETII